MIACNLSVILAEKNLKVADLFRMTGISRTTLHGLYNNLHTGIQWETLDKICKSLNVTPSELILYEDASYEVFSYDNSDIQDGVLFVQVKFRIKRRDYEEVYRVEVCQTGELEEPGMDIAIMYPPHIFDYVRSISPMFTRELELRIVKCVDVALGDGELKRYNPVNIITTVDEGKSFFGYNVNKA